MRKRPKFCLHWTEKRRAAAVVSTPTTTTTVTASTVPASSSSTTKTIDRQKEAILLDVGGSETTQRRSASLYDKILSNPKIELTSEGTIKLENSDTDIPLSTFLYRLQNPFPKSSPVTRQFLDIVENVKIPEHLIANQSLLKHQRSRQNKAPPLVGSDDDADDDEEDFESVDEGAGSSSRATSGKEKKGKEWYSVKGEKKQFRRRQRKKVVGESLEEWLLSVWIAPKFAKSYKINREKN